MRNVLQKIKNAFLSLKREYKEYSERERTISDAWFAIDTLRELTYEQAVEILKILKPNGGKNEN